MIKHRAAFYITIALSLSIGYGLFFSLQKGLEQKIYEELGSIKSFYGKNYTVKRIQKRLEINSKAKLTKNDFLIHFNETTQVFRTYTQPTTNPDELNFSLLFRQQIQQGDKVYVLVMIPVIETKIKKKYGFVLDNDYPLIYNISLYKNENIPNAYSNKLAIKAFCQIASYVKITIMVSCLLLGLFIYFKKWNA